MSQIGKTVLLAFLRGYKRALSPMFPPACRYVPTCSEYATEAVERYGALRGAAMALWRLLRCHPFAQGGLDLVLSPAAANGCRVTAHREGLVIPESPVH